MSSDLYAVIPSNPADRKTILDALEEISNAKTRAEAEMDYIKETVSDLAEKFEIKKPVINKLWRFHHKRDAKDVKRRMDEVFDAYETLTGEALDE